MAKKKPLNEESMRWTSAQKAKVDDVDWSILELLAQDARMPTSQLARRLGVSRDVVKYRIRRMLSEGIILSFLTFSNLPKLGYGVWGYMNISFKDLTPEKEKEFKKYLTDSPSVLFAHSTLGAWDYGVELAARDPGHFHDLLKELKGKFSHIIKDYQSGLYVDIHKMTYVPPRDK